MVLLPSSTPIQLTNVFICMYIPTPPPSIQDGDNPAGQEESTTFAHEAVGFFGENDRAAGLKFAFEQPGMNIERGMCCNTAEARLRHNLQLSSSNDFDLVEAHGLANLMLVSWLLWTDSMV